MELCSFYIIHYDDMLFLHSLILISLSLSAPSIAALKLLVFLENISLVLSAGPINQSISIMNTGLLKVILLTNNLSGKIAINTYYSFL